MIMRPHTLLFVLLLAATSGSFAAPNFFSPNCSVDRESYSSVLRAANEPSLLEQSKAKPDSETYRLTLLRSFYGPTVSRIEVQSEGSAHAFSYEAVVAGFDSLRDRKSLSADDINQLRATFVKSDFWTIGPRKACVGCRDGSYWLIEVAKDGKYHCVERWSPQASPFKTPGLLLLKFTGLDDPEGPHDLGITFKQGDATLYNAGAVSRLWRLNDAQLMALSQWFTNNKGQWNDVRQLPVPTVSINLIFGARYPANVTLTTNSVVLNSSSEKKLSQDEMVALRKLIGAD